MYRTSGDLVWTKYKGYHWVTREWWVDTGIVGCAFRLLAMGEGPVSYMNNDGRLHAMPGYPWDGSSGPTVDGKADPVPSLAHDLLYEAMRARRVSPELRKSADILYRDMLIERGMSKARAWVRYIGLRLFGARHASPKNGPRFPERRSE